MHILLVGLKLHPTGHDPVGDGNARQRVVADGAHVPDVGDALYPAGHRAPTCGTGMGRRGSAIAIAATAIRINTAAPTTRATAGTSNTATTNSATVAAVHIGHSSAGHSNARRRRSPERSRREYVAWLMLHLEHR
jgi:hypothetical protein